MDSYDVVEELLDKYLIGVKTMTPNQYAAHPVEVPFNDVGVELFNRIYKALLKSKLKKLQRTPSGAIKKSLDNFDCYDVQEAGAGVRLTVYTIDTLYVLRVGRENSEPANNGWTGRKAYTVIKSMLAKRGINIEDYAVKNGKEIKATIDPPLIDMRILNETLENVHHIDFHNSYPAGLINTHPEFREVIETLYKNRKKHPENKLILNAFIGYCQSETCCGAKYAQLSKDAIEDNNLRVALLSSDLVHTGRKIVGYNTDGIWYQGKPYHSFGEGDTIGTWHNDHLNCTFRAKSDGAYEFIENGKYYPVLRGRTKLDDVKPRESWEWGDIFTQNADVVYRYKFVPRKGIIKEKYK